VVSFTRRPLYTLEIAHGTNWIEGCMGPGIGLNDVKKIKILPLPELELRPLGP
jgi:hypothetical protein